MKFVCECGYIMKFHTDHLPYSLKLIQSDLISDFFDEALNKLSGASHNESGLLDAVIDQYDSSINLNSLNVMKCPNCERFYVENEFGLGTYTAFIKEVSSTQSRD